MATTTATKLPPFRLGKKQIFLLSAPWDGSPCELHRPHPLSILQRPLANSCLRPNFTLTLLRTPKLPPRFASFIVPLNLNKLDLRDYLYNCYGVRVLGVRSYIQQQKVRQDRPGEKRPAQRRWFRPRAIKKMMVELEKPFVWPDEPESFEPYVYFGDLFCLG